MHRPLGIVAAALLLMPGLALADPPANEDPRGDQVIKSARTDRSVGEVILYYLPNRIFDILDVVRLRVRLGPGLAARVRATEGVDVGVGSYTSVYFGLPGPRQQVELPQIVGKESYTGIELGPGDASVRNDVDPNYADTEFGVSVQAALIGIDVGIDPFEVLDFLVGIPLIDFRADDF
jgi:hypothetical protein